MIRNPLRQKPVVVYLIIKLNILVYLAWIFIAPIEPEFMIRNFLVSWDGLLQGRIWTLLTSVFSHNLFFHIFINMYAFLGFGMVLEKTLGSKKLLKFFLIAGIFSSLCHCLVSSFLMNQSNLSALGASGSVAGVVLLFSLMFPREKILILGILPIPALFASLLIVGLDVWGLLGQINGSSSLPIGHGAHLGGAIYGLFYYFIFVRPKKNEAQVFGPYE